VIAVAVRWYLRYGLSYRDVEELLAERGFEVDHGDGLSLGAHVHPAVHRCCSPGSSLGRGSVVRR
jgi:transposase-like protein